MSSFETPDNEFSNDVPETVGLSRELRIETSRMILRPPVPRDADEIQVLINDKEIAANTRTIDYPYPPGAAMEWVEKHSGFWDTGKAFTFSILSKGSSELMGAMGLDIDDENHSAELGYWLGKKYWNQGFCTEAARQMVVFGFERIGLHKIFAHHVARNPASGRVLEKIGMKKEGQLRSHVRKWGVFEDIVIYGMLESDERI